MDMNFDPPLIDALALAVTEELGVSSLADRADEAIAEQFDFHDRESMSQEDVVRAYHSLWGRALLRAAENEFIQALGMVDDETPSRVPVVGQSW